MQNSYTNGCRSTVAMNLRPINASADTQVYSNVRTANADLIWDVAVDKICYKLLNLMRDRIELNITHNTYTVVHGFLREQINETK
jgi:hypothetical protein